MFKLEPKRDVSGGKFIYASSDSFVLTNMTCTANNLSEIRC